MIARRMVLFSIPAFRTLLNIEPMWIGCSDRLQIHVAVTRIGHSNRKTATATATANGLGIHNTIESIKHKTFQTIGHLLSKVEKKRQDDNNRKNNNRGRMKINWEPNKAERSVNSLCIDDIRRSIKLIIECNINLTLYLCVFVCVCVYCTLCFDRHSVHPIRCPNDPYFKSKIM